MLFLPSLSDVSAQLMTALLAPALQVLTFNVISKIDTKIHRCKCCGQNLLGAAAYKIHLHERHSKLITEEADGPQNETMMKAALGLIKK